MPGGLPLFPEGASSIAGSVDALFFFLLGVSLLFSLVITAMIIYFAVKYRRRAPDQIGALITGSTKLETAWMVIPLMLGFMLFHNAADFFAKLIAGGGRSRSGL